MLHKTIQQEIIIIIKKVNLELGLTIVSRKLFKKCQQAAAKGNVIAHNTLVFLYLNGQGIEQNHSALKQLTSALPVISLSSAS